MLDPTIPMMQPDIPCHGAFSACKKLDSLPLRFTAVFKHRNLKYSLVAFYHMTKLLPRDRSHINRFHRLSSTTHGNLADLYLQNFVRTPRSDTLNTNIPLKPKHRRGTSSPTSSDLTHRGDGRLIWWDAAEWFGLHRSVARNAQHQSEETLVPAERLLGQLAAWQRRGERKVELEEGDRSVNDKPNNRLEPDRYTYFSQWSLRKICVSVGLCDF